MRNYFGRETGLTTGFIGAAIGEPPGVKLSPSLILRKPANGSGSANCEATDGFPGIGVGANVGMLSGGVSVGVGTFIMGVPGNPGICVTMGTGPKGTVLLHAPDAQGLVGAQCAPGLLVTHPDGNHAYRGGWYGVGRQPLCLAFDRYFNHSGRWEYPPV